MVRINVNKVLSLTATVTQYKNCPFAFNTAIERKNMTTAVDNNGM